MIPVRGMRRWNPPSSSEYDEGCHVKCPVAVILLSRVCELDHVDDVLVPKTGTEVVELVLPHQRKERVRANPVPEGSTGEKDG